MDRKLFGDAIEGINIFALFLVEPHFSANSALGKIFFGMFDIEYILTEKGVENISGSDNRYSDSWTP